MDRLDDLRVETLARLAGAKPCVDARWNPLDARADPVEARRERMAIRCAGRGERPAP